MYEYFFKNYFRYLIENTDHYLIYLIPGEELSIHFKWYGEERAKAFGVLHSNSVINDIEERDFYYTHMVIWDKKYKVLAAGQRFLFNKKDEIKNKSYSYLEYYHPKTYEELQNISFCEIGRTFVMPSFQNKRLLKELIRGFIRIPESRNINIGIGLISFDHRNLKRTCISKFLNILNNSKKNPLNLPAGKYLFDHHSILQDNTIDLSINSKNLKFIEKELKEIDKNFELPRVLKPYLQFCEISYENYSIAKNYNGIIQLLFSGRSEDISEKQRRFLKKYDNLQNF